MRKTLTGAITALTLLPALAAGAQTLDFGYCYEPASANGMTLGEVQKYAIYIPQETVERFAGAELESVVIANGCIPNDDHKHFKLGLYKDRDDSAEAAIRFTEADMDVRAFGQWKTYEFAETYTLKADEPFYVVMEFPVKYYPRNEDDAEDAYLPCAVDWSLTPDDKGYSDMLYYCGYDGKYEWNNLGPLTGNNCIRLRLKGDCLPQYDMMASSLKVPSRITPFKEFEGTVVLTNQGVQQVTECTYKVQVGDGEPQTLTKQFVDEDGNPAPLGYHESWGVTFAATPYVEGPAVPIKLWIESVNGQPDEYAANNEATTSTMSMADGCGYFRNLFIEEATGNWCGWCPMGIVGFEHMRAEHPSEFCGVAVHTGTDPLVVADGSYDDIVTLFNGTAPLMFPNRDTTQPVNPSYYNLNAAYEYYCQFPSYINVEVEPAEITDQLARFEARYEFAGAADPSIYSLAYIITEDNVGPYTQKNDFPTGYMGDMEGWESMPRYVEVTYNDVARTKVDVTDTEGIFPEAVEGGVTYRHRTAITLPEGVKGEDVNIIAVVLNKQTGLVENCTISRARSFSGIQAVTAPTDGPVEYFDLQGRRVNGTPTPGIYIQRQGQEATKVLIR